MVYGARRSLTAYSVVPSVLNLLSKVSGSGSTLTNYRPASSSETLPMTILRKVNGENDCGD